MGNGSWFVLLVRIAYGLYVWIRERGRKTHDASVRADGGTAWLQQRGGVDKRPCPGPDDAGAIVTDGWAYEHAGEWHMEHGEWIHLPASEGAELLLWIERAEAACR